MTIKKGEGWGRPAGHHPDLPIAADDAQLAAIANSARRNGQQAVAGVERGDLLRTIGIAETRPETERFDFPVDLGLVVLDASADADGGTGAVEEIPFVAHVAVLASGLTANQTLCRLLGHGPPISVAIMNAAWYGPLRLGPRAHPNDGRLDIVDGRVPFRERREAARRAATGSHHPHPALQTLRAAAWERRFDGSAGVVVDGVYRGSAGAIRVELLADALTVVA